MLLDACEFDSLFVEERDKKYREKQNKIYGALKLSEMISICNNNAPVYPVLPGLILFTDDSTVFVFKGKAENLDGWYLLQSTKKATVQGANQ